MPLPELNDFNMKDVYVQGNEIVFPLISSASLEKSDHGGSPHFAILRQPNNQNTNSFLEVPNSTSGYISFLTTNAADYLGDIAVDANGNTYING